KADTGSKRVTSIPYGCHLYGEKHGDLVKVDSQRYGEFFIPNSNLASHKDDSLKFTVDNLIIETEKFLGAPYLWGGRSFFGIDCSGFSQCILRRFGVELPRDSSDQRNHGIEIARKDIQAGDLLFFPGHVTIAVSDTLMIHSSLGNGGVAYNSLDPESPIYSEYFDENLQNIRRVLP
ncbi:MAG: C40 family peptidase, partial [candidate division Zixibacteria bacterium]